MDSKAECDQLNLAHETKTKNAFIVTRFNEFLRTVNHDRLAIFGQLTYNRADKFVTMTNKVTLSIPITCSRWAFGGGAKPIFHVRDFIYTRQHICYSAYMLSLVRPSVCLSVRLSVRRVDHTKTVEDRIMKFSPYGSPIPVVFREQVSSRNFEGFPRAGALNEVG